MVTVTLKFVAVRVGRAACVWIGLLPIFGDLAGEVCREWRRS
jgi:hypothetical protein